MGEDSQNTREKIEIILNQVPCGIGLYESDNKSPVFLNRAFYILTGYDEKEYMQLVNSNGTLVYADDRETVNRCMQEYNESGKTAGCEYRMVRKDGSSVWVKMNLNQIQMNRKNYVLCAFTDIAEEHKTADHLNLIAENIPSSISLISIDRGKETLIYANSYFYTLIGLPKEQYLANMEVLDRTLVSQEDFRRTGEAVKRAIQSGTAEEVVYQFHRPDQKVLWLSRRFTVIPQGSPSSYLIVSTVRDITEQRNAEIQTELVSRRYQLAVRDLKAVVLEWNNEDHSFYASDGYSKYEMSKASQEDIVNDRGSLDLVHPDDRGELQSFFHRVASGEHNVPVVLRLKMTDGDYQWSRISGFRINDEKGKLIRTVGVIANVSEEHEKTFMLNGILNEIPGGIALFEIGKTWKCIYFSDGFGALSKRTRAETKELLSHPDFLQTLIDPSDYQQFTDEVTDRMAKNLPINLTFRYLLKNQSVSWLHMTATRMGEENGHAVYYCVFTIPSQETALYQNIVQESAVGVFAAEKKTRRILFMNDVMREIYNIPKRYQDEDVSLYDRVPENEHLLNPKQVMSLKPGHYSQFHVMHDSRYFGIKAKFLIWNGVDSYILYVTDETAEHQNQIRLQELIDRVPSGVGIFEIEHGIAHQVYMNDGFYRMVGDTRENREKRSHGDFAENIYPEDLTKISHGIEELVKGKDAYSFNYRVVLPDGNYKWLRLMASVQKRNGDNLTVYMSYIDHTEAMEARKALERNNETLRLQYEQESTRRKLLEKDSILSVSWDAETGAIQDMQVRNEIVQEIPNGKTCNKYIETIMYRVPDPEDRRKLKEAFALHQNTQELLKEKTVEYRSMQKDGLPHWMRLVCSSARDHVSGHIWIYAYFYDINKEKKISLANASVIDEEIDSILLYNVHSGDAYIIRGHQQFQIKDLENPVLYLPDILNDPVNENIMSEDRPAVREFLDPACMMKHLETEESTSVQFRCNENGKIYWKRAKAFYLDSTKEDIVVVRRDITEMHNEEQRQKEILKKAADDANKANQAKSEFLSRMSHDMRTPMNGILGLAQLSEDEEDVNVLKDSLSKIRESGNYLLSLINDTLDFQRIESGKITLVRSVVSLQSLQDSILDIVRENAVLKKVEFRLETNDLNLNQYVKADPVRTKQIFVNLLSNAVKFTPEGGLVTFSVQSVDEEGNCLHLHFKVSDTGIGMSRAFIRDSLYQPFSQEANDLPEKYAGSGLGLSIVHSLVTMMNGTIAVESERGSGTIFTVDLSFEKVRPSEAEALQKQNRTALHPDTEKLKGKRILLAEDHPLNAEIAQRLLQKAGCISVWAENGKKADELYEQAAAGTYDAILMDIRMPVMDGLQAARLIRASAHADAKTIPILAMTANAYDEDIRKSLDAGMNAHLAKPIDPSLLYEALEKYIH